MTVTGVASGFIKMNIGSHRNKCPLGTHKQNHTAACTAAHILSSRWRPSADSSSAEVAGPTHPVPAGKGGGEGGGEVSGTHSMHKHTQRKHLLNCCATSSLHFVLHKIHTLHRQLP